MGGYGFVWPAAAQAPAGPNATCGLTVAGKVIDQHQGQALAAATLHLVELNQTVATDAAGNYHFHHLCPGTYHLRVRYLGFAEQALTVELKASAIRNVKLHPVTDLLATVEVRGRKEPPTPTQGHQSLSNQALDQTRGGSLGEALQNLSGVNSLQTGPTIAKPIIHGLHSNRILMLNNGVRHEAQQWGTEHAPEIDPFVADKLTVVKGAAGVRYGSDAIGGVVLVEPAPLRDSAGTNGTLNLVGAGNNRLGVFSATVDHRPARHPAWAARVQGTLKKAGNSRAAAYYLGNTGFDEQNISATVGYRKNAFDGEVYYSRFNTQLGILAVAHIGNLTDLKRALATDIPLDTAAFTYAIDRPYQRVRHDLLKAAANWRLSNGGRLQYLGSLQSNLRQEYDTHRSANDEPQLNFTINTATSDLIWEHRNRPHWTGSAGLNFMAQQNQYTGRFFIPNYRNYGGGAFWLERWRSGKFQVEAGVRFDYKYLRVSVYQDTLLTKPVYRFRNFSGTVGAVYAANDRLTLRFNAGSAWRAPGVNELFSNGLHHGSAAIEIGNPNFKAENAYNLIFTATYQNATRLSGEVSVYRNYIQDYIYQAPDLNPVLTYKGAFITYRYQQINATFRGLDAAVNYVITPALTGQAKASLVRAYDQTHADYLILTPPDRFDGGLRYAFKSRAGFGPSFLSVGGQYVRRQDRLPRKVPGPSATDNPYDFTFYNGDYAPAPGAFFLLQASVGTQLKLGRQRLEMSLRADNLGNVAYRNYLNRFRYFANETGRNVTLLLKIPFNFTKATP